MNTSAGKTRMMALLEENQAAKWAAWPDASAWHVLLYWTTIIVGKR